MIDTVDGQNSAPPTKPWIDESPCTCQAMVAFGFQVAKGFVHPRYGLEQVPGFLVRIPPYEVLHCHSGRLGPMTLRPPT